MYSKNINAFSSCCGMMYAAINGHCLKLDCDLNCAAFIKKKKRHLGFSSSIQILFSLNGFYHAVNHDQNMDDSIEETNVPSIFISSPYPTLFSSLKLPKFLKRVSRA